MRRRTRTARSCGGSVLQFLLFAVPMLACALLGMGMGVHSKRWGAPGRYALTIRTLLTAGLVAIWLTWRKA